MKNPIKSGLDEDLMKARGVPGRRRVDEASTMPVPVSTICAAAGQKQNAVVAVK
ncbi:MAG: hypothetical protein J0I94_10760 [Thiobacillus sp.]|jgi:hypothetical protein|nr:hypothetical protein [Thiobacillus sp.]